LQKNLTLAKGETMTKKRLGTNPKKEKELKRRVLYRKKSL
jgi:hypothetical protein